MKEHGSSVIERARESSLRQWRNPVAR